MSQRFSVYLPSNLAKWVDEQARREGRSRNNYITKVLREKMEGRELAPGETRRLLKPLART